MVTWENDDPGGFLDAENGIHRCLSSLRVEHVPFDDIQSDDVVAESAPDELPIRLPVMTAEDEARAERYWSSDFGVSPAVVDSQEVCPVLEDTPVSLGAFNALGGGVHRASYRCGPRGRPAFTSARLQRPFVEAEMAPGVIQGDVVESTRLPPIRLPLMTAEDEARAESYWNKGFRRSPPRAASRDASPAPEETPGPSGSFNVFGGERVRAKPRNFEREALVFTRKQYPDYTASDSSGSDDVFLTPEGGSSHYSSSLDGGVDIEESVAISGAEVKTSEAGRVVYDSNSLVSAEDNSPEANTPSTTPSAVRLPPLIPSLRKQRARLAAKMATDTLTAHMELLRVTPAQHDFHELRSAPIFTAPVLAHAEWTQKQPGPHHVEDAFLQYGLLGGRSTSPSETKLAEREDLESCDFVDTRVFNNVAAPSSTFICGSQGSGKSHTLSCLLENYLLPSDAAVLPKPLCGIVFHYDTFISDEGGSPCEAAFLSSAAGVNVRVLCSPTNVRTIKAAYARFPTVKVEALEINQTDLNTKRMLDMMAVSNDGPMPLYLHMLYRILREMRVEQQASGSTFSYAKFKALIELESLSPAQSGPLKLRLDTLESFMPASQIAGLSKSKKQRGGRGGTNWTAQAGHLTIVDLSCPCVTPEGACALFNICLSIFLEQYTPIGRVVALDEAHKYMNASAEAETLTETLLSTIRLQRHLGTRVIISTQEPTVSPKLLDLSNVTIVHRFQSPAWLATLRNHLAAATATRTTTTTTEKGLENNSGDGTTEAGQSERAKAIFGAIVGLRVGEALLFSPTAMTGVVTGEDGAAVPKMLGAEYLRLRIRARLTLDGGQSVMAS